MLVLLGVLVTLVVFWFRGRRRGDRWHAAVSAEGVLAERYARGEIDVEEYQSRLAVLRERRN
jgi:putative membrane protein